MLSGEDMTDFKHAFPDFTLEDKSPVEVGVIVASVETGNEDASIRQSQRSNKEIPGGKFKDFVIS